jgi:cold shock CspA family protein
MSNIPRRSGVIISYGASKAYGFIALLEPDSQQDSPQYFFHKSDFKGASEPRPGDAVSFTPVMTAKGGRAFFVSPLPLEAVQS